MDGFPDAFACLEFREKPDLETARRYVASGDYKWNSGMFVFHAGRFMEMPSSVSVPSQE